MSFVELLAGGKVVGFGRKTIQALVSVENALEQVRREQGSLGVDGGEGVAGAGLQIYCFGCR